MKLSSLARILSSSLTVIGLTVLASGSSAKAASLSFNQSNLSLYKDSTAVNFDIKLEDLGDGKVQVGVNVADGYFADLRGLFFNISDDTLLNTLSIDTSLSPHVTAFAKGSVSSVGSNNNTVNGGGNTSFDFGVEIGDEGIGKNKLDIRSTTFVIQDASKKLNVNYFSQQSFGIRMMSVGTSANRREGSSKLTASSLPSVTVVTPSKEEKPVEASPNLPPVGVVTPPKEEKPVEKPVEVSPNLPPVVIVTNPPKEEKPVEVPEPGATAALALATIAAVKFAKRKKEVVA